jgi:hypothetical protein
MAFQNPLKSRWVILLIGFIVGVFASSATMRTQSDNDKATTLILKQMLAIENIEKTQGREPSSKAEIDAEVGRWDDYALRVLTLQKTGKPYDSAFVTEPWHQSKS